MHNPEQNEAMQPSPERPELKLEGNDWVLPSDPTIVSEVADEFARRLRAAGWSEDEIHLPFVGFTEALNNAILHGNLGLKNSEKYADHQTYERTKAAALASEAAQRSIHVTIDTTAGLARLTVRDEGPGFDVSSLPDPTRPELLLEESGRGVFLMRVGFDEVEYNEVGNEVTLRKVRRAV